MHRTLLPPPRPVLGPVEILEGESAAGARPVRPASPSLDRGRLPGPSVASTRFRRFLDPSQGWLRRFARRPGRFLSRRILPRIPGISRPYSAYLGRGLSVSEAAIGLPGLGPGLRGARVLLITDIHIGPLLEPSALHRAFERLLTLRPDVILLGGDLTTTGMKEFSPFADAFRLLAAPLGVYGVLGNHDHMVDDPEGLRRQIEETGVRVLHNRAVTLERGGARLVLAGLDDLIKGDPDLDAALPAAADAPDGPVVLLSHNPDIFFEAAGLGVSLVLAGHTHGGQIRIPGLPVLIRMSRYRLDEGRYSYRGSELVVSRGIGAVGLPVRWNCRPEAVLVELQLRVE